MIASFFWYAREDSNLWPLAPEDFLPPEPTRAIMGLSVDGNSAQFLRDYAIFDSVRVCVSSIIQWCAVMPRVGSLFPIYSRSRPDRCLNRSEGNQRCHARRGARVPATPWKSDRAPAGKPHWRVRVWVDDPASGKRKLQTSASTPRRPRPSAKGRGRSSSGSGARSSSPRT